MSESEYLAQQAADAKAAMSRTIEELSQSLKDSADPRYWTRQHPWAAVGAALAGGFVAATVLVPRKQERGGEVRRRDEFEVLDGQPEAAADGDEAEAPGEEPPAGRQPSRILASLASPLFDVLKVVLDNALTALVSSTVASRTAAEELDGAEADEAGGAGDADSSGAY
ncbi:MAG: hypothetical protein WD278_20235 [Pirellulales bacterium]